MLSKLLSPLTVFVASCTFLALLYGFAAAHFSWFPDRWLRPALDQGAALFASGLQHFVSPAVYEPAGARSYDAEGRERSPTPEELDGEIILLASAWPHSDGGLRPGIRAIDRQGEVLHAWPVRIREIWPTSPHTDKFAGTFNVDTNYVHGTYLFENGDVLFSVEYLGLVRLDAAGNVVWRLDRRTHHSVHRAENGNFWVCAARWVEDAETVVRRFPGLIPPVVEDLALEVTPDGEVVREISLLEAVWRSEHRARFWSLERRSSDVLHCNDVEPLGTALAAEYPLFEAGDLLVSARNLDLVFVIDPNTLTMRWSADRPHLRQHDPDFLGDGWISVFDNRTDHAPRGEFLGGSRLIALRPHTGEVRTIHPAPGTTAPRFYTPQAGKAQRLESGNWLITEAVPGRVFEVDASGRTVWEWIQEPVDGLVAEVLEGTRYPVSRAQVAAWGPR